MSILSEKAPRIFDLIRKSDRILLHCHPSPDPDCLGSALAMKFALESLGKKMTVIQGDSEIPVAFDGFPGRASVVAAKFGDVKLSDFDLFLILDSAGPEQISRYTQIKFPLEIPTAIIDHHKTNPELADINLVDHSYSSTAELLYNVFQEWGIKLNHDIALNLFMGIYGDTGGFQYEGTTAETFAVASKLVALAPEFHSLISVMANSNTPNYLIFQSLVLNHITTYLNGHLAISAVPNAAIREKNIPVSDVRVGFYSGLLKSVIGWDVVAVIAEAEPGSIRASFRTRDASKYDVSKLAAALGGGGHVAAAGAVLRGSLSEAVKTVVDTAKGLYNL